MSYLHVVLIGSYKKTEIFTQDGPTYLLIPANCLVSLASSHHIISGYIGSVQHYRIHSLEDTATYPIQVACLVLQLYTTEFSCSFVVSKHLFGDRMWHRFLSSRFSGYKSEHLGLKTP